MKKIILILILALLLTSCDILCSHEYKGICYYSYDDELSARINDMKSPITIIGIDKSSSFGPNVTIIDGSGVILSIGNISILSGTLGSREIGDIIK